MSYDAVVVGASVAGCTTARLLALQGARVALVEKRPDRAAYKTVCTHYLQPSATPVIEKLGLAGTLDERGANHNSIDVWTPYGGWIRTGETGHDYGFNITRRTLDPLLRELAAETDGVELLTGLTVTALTGGDRPTGVEATDRHGKARRLDGRMVVGADGRGSVVARLADMRGRVRPHNRFFHWAYWRGVEPGDGRSRMWFTEPDCAYTFPNEDGLTLVLVGPHRDRREEFRADLEGAYLRMLAELPDGPDLSNATRESKIIGKLDLPNVSRPAAKPGVALAGDAALASDPLWGIGCGWAFQTGDWLATETGPALVGGSEAELDAALDRYRRLHRRRLGPHHFLIADLASARPANPLERMMYRAATRDPVVRDAFAQVGARTRSPAYMFRPATVARMVRAGV